MSLISRFSAIFLMAFLWSNFQTANGQGLPKYIKACHRDDPKLNECALKQARASSAIFARGDPVRGNPRLDPLEVKEIKTATFETTRFTGIKILFSDSVVTGLADLEVKDFTIDVKKQLFTANATGNLNIASNYEMSGYFLFIPLRGRGPSNVTLSDVKISYEFNYDIIIGKRGIKYMKFSTDDLYLDIGFAQFNMDNLFFGISLFSGTANNLLNEYWRDVVAELAPPFIKVLKESFENAANVLLAQVPYDELLLP